MNEKNKANISLSRIFFTHQGYRVLQEYATMR